MRSWPKDKLKYLRLIIEDNADIAKVFINRTYINKLNKYESSGIMCDK